MALFSGTWEDTGVTFYGGDAVDACAFTTTATLDATPTNVTLSGGNLTATHNSAVAGGAKTASTKLNACKYYFEVTLTNITTADRLSGFGILRNTGTYANITNTFPDNTVLYVGNGGGVPFGAIWANAGDSTMALGALANGDVIGVAVDFVSAEIWFRKAPSGNWNGSALANPATTVSGVTISGAMNSGANACGPAIGYGGTNEVMTVNFGATAFVGAVPSGFKSGWPL